MRTTQKKLRELYRELRLAVGERTNHKALLHSYARQTFFAERLKQHDVSPVTLTPHANNTWTLRGYDNRGCAKGQVRCPGMAVSLDEWLHHPEELLTEFIETFISEPLKS